MGDLKRFLGEGGEIGAIVRRMGLTKDGRITYEQFSRALAS